MNFSLDPYVTLLAVVSVFALFSLWYIGRTLHQNRQIKKLCIGLCECIAVLRHTDEAVCVSDLSADEKKSFAQIQQAFNQYIKPSVKYRQNLLSALNSLCGTSYSLFDMHDCFENSRINSFFKDVVERSGFLFINVVYMSGLEQSGFYIQLNGETKVQEKL
ncbi:MAG: hypothetical protein AB7E96_10760 [Deferribacterales bacterium]